MQPVESRGNPIRSTAATRRVQFYGALFFNNYRFPRSRNSWPFSGPNIGASFGAGASARQLSGFGECRSGLIECSGRKWAVFLVPFFLEKTGSQIYFGEVLLAHGRLVGQERNHPEGQTLASHVPVMISSPDVCKVMFRLQAEQHLQVALLSLVLLRVREWKSECFFSDCSGGSSFSVSRCS